MQVYAYITILTIYTHLLVITSVYMFSVYTLNIIDIFACKALPSLFVDRHII